MASNTNSEAAPPMSPKPASLKDAATSDEHSVENTDDVKETAALDRRRAIWILYNDIPKLLQANKDLPGTPLLNIEIWTPGYYAKWGPAPPYFIVSGDVQALVNPDEVLEDMGYSFRYPWKITDIDVKLIKSLDGIFVGQPIPDEDLRHHESMLIYVPRPSGLADSRDDQFEIPLPKSKSGDTVLWDPFAVDPEEKGKHLVEATIVKNQGWSKPSEP